MRFGPVRRRGERGSSSLDAAIAIPALLLFLLVIIAGARIAIAQQSITVAAQAAARAASLERSGPEAVRAGGDAAHRSLQGSGLTCQPDVSVTGNWNLPLGTPGTATATVTCRVTLSDLAIPGMPGEIVVVRTAQSPIDPYRSRTGR